MGTQRPVPLHPSPECLLDIRSQRSWSSELWFWSWHFNKTLILGPWCLVRSVKVTPQSVMTKEGFEAPGVASSPQWLWCFSAEGLCLLTHVLLLGALGHARQVLYC